MPYALLSIGRFLDITFMGKDRPRTVRHLQVSGDSKGLIYTLETIDALGKKKVKTRHYVPVSGADGLAVGWRNVELNPSQVLTVKSLFAGDHA